MKWIKVSLLVFFSSSSFADCVILIHGLGRSDLSMQKMQKTLTKAEYTVVNTRYRAKDKSIKELARRVISKALTQCPSDTHIHFVTHSLGGILLRDYLSQQSIAGLKRVVMLGPPNKGSEVADTLRESPLYPLLKNQIIVELGTNNNSKPNTLDGIDAEVGIVAGNRSMNGLLSSIIEGADDGKVSVENTKLDAMNDHIILPTTHTFMMQNQHVIRQTLHFLEHGHFSRQENKRNSRDASQGLLRSPFN